jgi:hypothetical protein
VHDVMASSIRNATVHDSDDDDDDWNASVIS